MPGYSIVMEIYDILKFIVLFCLLTILDSAFPELSNLM